MASATATIAGATKTLDDLGVLVSYDECTNVLCEVLDGWRAVVLVDDTVGGEVVLGSARMGPNRPGPGSHVGTASFMVAPAARGRGVGRALGEHVHLGVVVVTLGDHRPHAQALPAVTGTARVVDAVGMEAHGSPVGKAAHAAVGMLPDALAKPMTDKMAIDRLDALRTAMAAQSRELDGLLARSVDQRHMESGDITLF